MKLRFRLYLKFFINLSVIRILYRVYFCYKLVTKVRVYFRVLFRTISKLLGIIHNKFLVFNAIDFSDKNGPYFGR